MQSLPLVNLDQIEGSLVLADGMAIPQWEVVEQWVDQHIDEGVRPRARAIATEQWLAKLAASIGYEVVTSDNFYIMTRAQDDERKRLIRICEDCLQQAVDALQLAQLNSQVERMTVLAFAAWRPFWRYLQHIMPPDMDGMAQGVFVGGLYPCVVMNTKPADLLKRVLAHELTHACLDHLPLPLWLNEGLTRVCEDVIIGTSILHLDSESADHEREFWRENTLEPFWDGTMFYSEAAWNAYKLAEILVRTMHADFRNTFPKFVEQAHRADAGQAAARAVLGVGLEDRAAIYLGPGDWQPKGGYEESTNPDDQVAPEDDAASVEKS